MPSVPHRTGVLLRLRSWVPASRVIPPEALSPIQDWPGTLQVHDLGFMAYAPAFDLQKRLQEQVINERTQPDSARAMHLLLVEHVPPVITISRRPGALQHLVASESQLRAAGVELAQTDRGGDITYHGPGQLVVYPILDLNALGLRLNGYMRVLEEIVMRVLSEFGITGHRDPGATGVWVAQHSLGASMMTSAKICAMGVRISHWVSMHGLALNVSTHLDHFKLIVPCGLAGRAVTSMQQELGPRCPEMTTVKQTMVESFRNALGCQRDSRDH
jgi:lipoyl(octanoyl) transferase